MGGAGEKLALYDHADEGARDRDEEVRAAMLHTEFGLGMFVAARVISGQQMAWYDGERISPAQYTRLTAATGLWHTVDGTEYIF